MLEEVEAGDVMVGVCYYLVALGEKLDYFFGGSIDVGAG